MAAGQDRAGDAIRREWRLAWLAACQTHRYILTCLYADSARNRNDLVWKWTRGRSTHVPDLAHFPVCLSSKNVRYDWGKELDMRGVHPLLETPGMAPNPLPAISCYVRIRENRVRTKRQLLHVNLALLGREEPQDSESEPHPYLTILAICKPLLIGSWERSDTWDRRCDRVGTEQKLGG